MTFLYVSLGQTLKQMRTVINKINASHNFIIRSPDMTFFGTVFLHHKTVLKPDARLSNFQNKVSFFIWRVYPLHPDPSETTYAG